MKHKSVLFQSIKSARCNGAICSSKLDGFSFCHCFSNPAQPWSEWKETVDCPIQHTESNIWKAPLVCLRFHRYWFQFVDVLGE